MRYHNYYARIFTHGADNIIFVLTKTVRSALGDLSHCKLLFSVWLMLQYVVTKNRRPCKPVFYFHEIIIIIAYCIAVQISFKMRSICQYYSPILPSVTY